MRAFRLSVGQIVAQDYGAVVKGVVCAVQQGHGAAAAGLQDGCPAAMVRVQLVPVSAPKLIPAFCPMAEPLPELRAGCDLLHPRVRGEGFLLHASRPEALHEDSPAISARGRVVGALDLDHGVGSS